MRKKMKKQRVLCLNLDGTFDEKKLKRDAGIVYDGKNEVMMQPACVFTERNKRSLFRGRRKIVLFVEGTRRALKFRYVKDKDGKEKIELEDPQPFWTMREAKEFVAKETAKSLVKHKPMTWMQFVIILVPVLITLGIVVKLAMTFGAL